MVTIEEAIARMEAEYKRQYEEERRKIMERLKLYRKNRDKIYLCLDNGRVYFSKPRKCSRVETVTIEDFIERETSERMKIRTNRLTGWKWISENCSTILDRIIMSFPTETLYFDGGYLYVSGIDAPIIVLYVSKYSKEIEELLRALTRSPFRVDVFVGNDGEAQRPEEALRKLLELYSDSI